MIAVIDNYDSFVFNLVQALGAMGQEIRVFRNDAIDVDGLRALRPKALVLSPGPGRPEDAGVTIAAISQLSSTIPTLGVCLGIRRSRARSEVLWCEQKNCVMARRRQWNMTAKESSRGFPRRSPPAATIRSWRSDRPFRLSCG